MKYKRRIMAGMFALTLLTGNSTVYASDFDNLKASEFRSYVHMKSNSKEEKDDTRKRKITKKSSSKLHGLHV